MPKYIHNKSTYKVSLIDSKLLLNQGEKRQIEDSEADHPDVVHAIRAGWVTVEGPQSKTKTPDAPAPITFVEDPMKGSETIPVIKPRVDAVSSSIGAEEAEVESTSAGLVKKTKKSKEAQAAV